MGSADEGAEDGDRASEQPRPSGTVRLLSCARLTCSDGLKTSNWAESYALGRSKDKLPKRGQGKSCDAFSEKGYMSDCGE